MVLTSVLFLAQAQVKEVPFSKEIRAFASADYKFFSSEVLLSPAGLMLPLISPSIEFSTEPLVGRPCPTSFDFRIKSSIRMHQLRSFYTAARTILLETLNFQHMTSTSDFRLYTLTFEVICPRLPWLTSRQSRVRAGGPCAQNTLPLTDGFESKR